MNHFYLALLSLFCVFNCSTSTKTLFNEEPLVKVRILINERLTEIDLSSNGTISWENKSLNIDKGTLKIESKNDSVFVIRNGNELVKTKSLFINTENAFQIKEVSYGQGWWWAGKETRTYEGKLHIYSTDSDHFDTVLQLPLEEYVKGVIPYEIGSDTPIEALKAQAVAARTEIVQTLVTGKYKGDYYDVCADVECQVFAGNAKRTARTDSAVDLSKSQILMYQNEVIDAYFASNCGGKSERVEKVWPWRGGAKPYLVSRYDVLSPSDSVDYFKPQSEFQEWLDDSSNVVCNPFIYDDLPSWSKANFRWKKELPISTFDSLIIEERGESGRIHKAKVWKNGIDTTYTFELAIRKIGNPPLRSSAFKFERTDSSWEFSGAGWGHGVGMCQSGAVSRALRGQKVDEILSHYFTGTELVRSY